MRYWAENLLRKFVEYTPLWADRFSAVDYLVVVNDALIGVGAPELTPQECLELCELHKARIAEIFA